MTPHATTTTPTPAGGPPDETVADALNRLADDFAAFDAWEDRYAYLIDLGKAAPPYPASEREDVYLVRGCQSRVWLQTRLNAQSRVEVLADSDALIVKGLLAALCAVCSGKPPEGVAAFDIDTLITRLGFHQHLTPARNNGLRAAGKRVKDAAAAMAGLGSAV